MTLANVEKWVTLTDEGESQARSLEKWLTSYWNFEPDICITSTMKRAIDTVNLLNISIIAERYAELNETDAGDVSYWKRDDVCGVIFGIEALLFRSTVDFGSLDTGALLRTIGLSTMLIMLGGITLMTSFVTYVAVFSTFDSCCFSRDYNYISVVLGCVIIAL